MDLMSRKLPQLTLLSKWQVVGVKEALVLIKSWMIRMMHLTWERLFSNNKINLSVATRIHRLLGFSEEVDLNQPQEFLIAPMQEDKPKTEMN